MILYYHKNKPIRLLCNWNLLYEWKEYKQELCSYISFIQDDKNKAFLIKNAIDCHDNIMQMFMLKIKRM